MNDFAELRGCFERILCVARSSAGPTVGNIQLADRLISAVCAELGKAKEEGLTDSQHLDVLRGGPDPRVPLKERPDFREGYRAGFADGRRLGDGAGPQAPKKDLPGFRDIWRGIQEAQGLAAGLSAPGKLHPHAERVLRLAQVIREADPADRIGGWAHQLAEAILAHPGFSGCHDGPVALAVQGEVSNPWQPIETAPRDGTLVLTISESRYLKEMISDNYRLCNFSFLQYNRTRDAWVDRLGSPGYSPTHWQPLPSSLIIPNPHA